MDERPRDRDSRPPFAFNRREREFEREGNRPFRKSPPRDRPRFEDYDRFPSRFEPPPFDRRGRSPSPPRRMEDRPYGGGRNDDFYMRDRYRNEPTPREPYPRHGFDHRGDPYDRDRRDPYDSPRGPYPDRRDDRFDRYDSYGRDGRESRDYPRPGDYPGPAKRPRMDYDGPEDIYSSSKTIEAPTDCVIVVMNKQQRGYAELVQRRLKSVGLVVDLHFHGTQPIVELLDDVARRGVLYAIVITSQHEVHRSVTVNILHGSPQEHRNMPLDDAMRLVGQNFDQYMQDLRERAKASSVQGSSKDVSETVSKEEKSSEISSLLSKAAAGGSLSSDQLAKLIDNLSKRQQEVVGSTSTANGKGGLATTQPSQPAVDPQSIAKQQADLQAKILSILNPGGVAKPGVTSSSSLTQQAAMPSVVPSPSVATAAKSAALSTTAKPIFPLYLAQQKPVTPITGSGGYLSSSAAPGLGALAGVTGSETLSSTPSNQIGKSPQSALQYGATSASSAYSAAAIRTTPSAAYQYTKPGAQGVQSTYATGANRAATASSSSSYGSPASQRSQTYSAGTQAQKPTATSPSQSPISAISKAGLAGQAIGTIGVQRPNAVGRGSSGSLGGPRPSTGAPGVQMRAPYPMASKGRAGLLGASPAAGVRGPTQTVRAPAPSGSPGVRMGTPRGPSPVGRGTVRTQSPAGMQGQARGRSIAVRGGAISVRGGSVGRKAGTGATSTPGVAASQTASPNRGALVQRGASVARGIPTRGGGTALTRGSPANRGAATARGGLAPRGGPASRGGLISRGAPQMRGAPNARGGPSQQGAPIRSLGPGGRNAGQGPINRGAPRGRPMMRGGPGFRGGRGNSGGY